MMYTYDVFLVALGFSLLRNDSEIFWSFGCNQLVQLSNPGQNHHK